MSTPAFPSETMLGWESGMTLRDYFAAKAMQGFMADPENDMFPDECAICSYEMADAMMKAREQ